MEKEKILVIEDVEGYIEKIKTFYKDYYPKQVNLDIMTNFKDAEEKIKDVISKDKLGEYNYILMDGRLNGKRTDPLIITLLQENNVPPIISISAINEHAERYHLAHAPKGFLEHTVTSLYAILLGEKVKLKDNDLDFENLYLNGLIDHSIVKNRLDDNGYRKSVIKHLVQKQSNDSVIEKNKEEITNGINTSEDEKQSYFKRIMSKLLNK